MADSTAGVTPPQQEPEPDPTPPAPTPPARAPQDPAPQDPAPQAPAPQAPAPQEPAPQAGPASASRAVRAWRGFQSLGAANKIGALGLLVAVVTLVTPWLTAAYSALFEDDALAVLAEQQNDVCSTRWLTTESHADLAQRVPEITDATRARWQREGKIVHRGQVNASISVRGNMNKAVQLRDVSITVTKRHQPGALAAAEEGECGGGSDRKQQVLVVDLDTLPVGQPVSGQYLLTSPHQKAARKAAAEFGRPLLDLPTDVTTSSVYDLVLTGRTQHYTTEWRATLTWWDGKETHTTTIDNEGRPFRVSALPR
ncbi:hypothetical protein [Streptomyces sp. Da 82-17]|uniref:hypothetical protein n=1 Tax=Streptomyces sp. Da 82-17 TaxID=3377116 RepID=UPI0038D498E1